MTKALSRVIQRLEQMQALIECDARCPDYWLTTVHAAILALRSSPDERLMRHIRWLEGERERSAERASPSGLAEALFTYRAQHRHDCDSFRCAICSGLFSGDPTYACRCVGLLERFYKPCSCGLDALLKSAEGTK